MDGKGNYDSPKIDGKVLQLKKEHSLFNSENKSYVLYCLDCDKYDSRPEDKVFLEKVKQYCNKDSDRRFVWFCYDVEDVFLGKQVENKQKKNEAARFRAKNIIKTVDTSNLSARQYRSHKSNLCVILDEFLPRK